MLYTAVQFCVAAESRDVECRPRIPARTLCVLCAGDEKTREGCNTFLMNLNPTHYLCCMYPLASEYTQPAWWASIPHQGFFTRTLGRVVAVNEVGCAQSATTRLVVRVCHTPALIELGM